METTLFSTILALLAFVALIAANGFFVAAEYAFVTVDRPQIDAAARAGDRKARSVSKALKTLSFQLSGAQLGITITALLTGYLAEPALAQLVAPALGGLGTASTTVAIIIAMVVANILSMMFGELVPKNAALSSPFKTARSTASGQRVFTTAFGWLITILNGSANRLVRRMGVEPREELDTARAPDELEQIAAMSARAGALDRDTAMLVQRTLRFGNKRAAEAMTPRIDMTALQNETTVAELLRVAAETGYSRFPVYDTDIDNITGVVTLIDALGLTPARRISTPVRALAKEPVFVSEHLDLDELNALLRKGDADMAVVIDEYGGCDGVVTIEDLAEEFVGSIIDEHDAEEKAPDHFAHSNTNEALHVSGVLRSAELAEHTGFQLPNGPYETLAGFIMAQLGHVPSRHETVSYNDWTFTVTAMDRQRVVEIEIIPPPGWEPPSVYVLEAPEDSTGDES